MFESYRRYVSLLAVVTMLVVGESTGLLVSVSCAQQASGSQAGGDRAMQLQSMVDDLALQMQLSFANRNSEHVARYSQLAQALSSWNASARSDADFQVMQTWLQAATQASLPGANQSMPATPGFDGTAVLSGTAIENSDAYAGESATTNENTLGFAAETMPAGASLSSADGTTFGSLLNPAQGTIVYEEVIAEPAASTDNEPDDQPLALADRELDWSDPFRGNPFRDDPLPADPVYQPTKVAAKANKGRETRMKPISSQKPAVVVDTNELVSRVQGYNQKLKSVRADFVEEAVPTAFQMAAWLREMESLDEQRQFLDLYVGGLEGNARRGIPEFASPEGVLRQLAAMVTRRRQIVTGDPADSAAAERAILTALDKKVEEQWQRYVTGE